jgi:hypothetical protein
MVEIMRTSLVKERVRFKDRHPPGADTSARFRTHRIKYDLGALYDDDQSHHDVPRVHGRSFS